MKADFKIITEESAKSKVNVYADPYKVKVNDSINILKKLAKEEYIYGHTISVLGDMLEEQPFPQGLVLAVKNAVIPGLMRDSIGEGIAAHQTNLMGFSIEDAAPEILAELNNLVPRGVNAYYNKRIVHNEVGLETEFKKAFSVSDQLKEPANWRLDAGVLATANDFIRIAADEYDRVWVVGGEAFVANLRS